MSPFFAKRPVLRFVAIFGLLMAVFYGVFYTPPDQAPGLARVFQWHLSRYADASGAMLNLLGYGVTVTGTRIHAPRFSVEVVRGCDAMEAMAMFVAAILAFPARPKAKLWGILIGLPCLAALNLVRIVSLYVIGLHFHSIFETAHLGVWQTVFILATIVLWFVWAHRATRPSTTHARPVPA
jgi:exosortase H (IPTLxxWG-CTERM-specific)